MYILNNVDLITLVASLICGVLGGVFLVMQGFCWMSRQADPSPARAWLSITPVLWMWFRLARYEISYASAVQIHESFYDFAMLLCSMLFLFSLARCMSTVAPNKPAKTVGFALCTVLMNLSGPVARVFFYLLGEGDAYRAGQLAGVPDFAIGVLATVLSIYWIVAPIDQQSLEMKE
jgi:hypothetical protein